MTTSNPPPASPALCSPHRGVSPARGSHHPRAVVERVMVFGGLAGLAASIPGVLLKGGRYDETLAAAVLLLIFARTIAAFGRPARAVGRIPSPTNADLDAAHAIIRGQSWARPHLVFLRDKAMLFDGDKQAFVMFGTQGRTCVALGDPVGPRDRAALLIRRFLELCDASGGVPVFYQVRGDHLPLYANLGLKVVKLGEDARVDLAVFSLTGGHWSKIRQNLHRLERAGVRFRVVAAAETPTIMDRLKAVSDEWLCAQRGGEKGFSLGRFRPDYIGRFDIAVMEKGSEIIAFANLWAAAEHEELATDLIRHRRHAPPETMEALLVQAMTWAKVHGYRWFSLGMAPLAGLDPSSAAPLWSRVGAFLYAHGEPLYRFRGLRTFKQKFRPQWEPRYLVCRDGVFLPRVGADVAALIAGGYRKVVLK